MVRLKKLRSNHGAMPLHRPSKLPTQYWDTLPWKSVEANDLGDFEDAVFYSLEEVDGNALIASRESKAPKNQSDDHTNELSTATTNTTPSLSEDSIPKESQPAAPVDKKRKRKAKAVEENEAKARKKEKTITTIPAPEEISFEEWNGIYFHSPIVKSLLSLGFTSPTPIQAKAIPIILRGKSDLVGVAETGSGKSLAFLLPMINSLLSNWIEFANCSCPYAVILTPTRELAMQISKVGHDVCANFKSMYDIQIASVIGGMSIQKQRRQLGGKGRSAHIIVATPGRLCDMCNDEETVALTDMSRVRFLIIDEADRMVEEGHFPEVQRILSRIKDHEDLVAKGKDPKMALVEARRGVDEEEEVDRVKVDGEHEEEMVINDIGDPENPTIDEQSKAPITKEPLKRLNFRQTLLFSATMGSAQDRNKKQKKVKGIGGAARSLPYHVQQLLSAVGSKGNIEVVNMASMTSADHQSPVVLKDGSKETKKDGGIDGEGVAVLPKTLTQLEVKVPAEDKDVATYHYILRNSGRTLVFVNSIKAARRIDGLLRALNVNSRAIHAQMQQRQRLRALDSFKAAPIGVLVATDVAGIRDLFFFILISSTYSIKYVIHYSARS